MLRGHFAVAVTYRYIPFRFSSLFHAIDFIEDTITMQHMLDNRPCAQGKSRERKRKCVRYGFTKPSKADCQYTESTGI